MPGVIWPDVEAAFVGYMSAALSAVAATRPYASDVTVGTKAPRPMPGRVVTVRDDGGPVLGDARATARLGVNVWAESDEVCADLAALVVALIGAWPDGDPVIRAVPTRAAPVPEESGKPHRYLTAEVWVRGTSL